MTLGLFTAVLLAVLALFGAAMAWAGAAVAAKVTTPWAREAIAATALTLIGVAALVLAAGELGLTRSLLPRVTMTPAAPRAGGLSRRAIAIALGFGATMAIFSPLSAYALVIGWVAARQSAWLGAVTLAAYGLGLMIPLALAGTLMARRRAEAVLISDVAQRRLRTLTGVSLALAGGFLLAMWTLRATWALFLSPA